MSATSLWDKEKNYGSTSRVNHDLLDKLNKVIQSRERWPRYSAMEEGESCEIKNGTNGMLGNGQ